MRKQWEQHRDAYFIDVPNVGRYLVKRLGKRQAFAASLNGKQIDAIEPNRSLTSIKDQVMDRINSARRIARSDDTFILRRGPEGHKEYFTDTKDAWSPDRAMAKAMPAREAALLFEQAHRMISDVEMVLALSDRTKTISTQKMWLANWATPEEAEAQNDDRGLTAFYMAHPAGIILMRLDEEVEAALKKKAVEEWISDFEDDTDAEVRDAYKNATWSETAESGENSFIYALIGEDKQLLGMLIISSAEVMA